MLFQILRPSYLCKAKVCFALQAVPDRVQDMLNQSTRTKAESEDSIWW